MRLETLLVHGAEPGPGDNVGTPTLPPVQYSTAFYHETAESLEQAFKGVGDTVYYSRMRNPTVQALEQRMAQACRAPSAVATTTGMAAISTTLMAMLKTGDELIAGPHLFGGSYALFTKTLVDFGITVRFADPTDVGSVAALINDKTRGVYVEAIANPQMTVPDFPGLKALCAEHGLPLLVDATLLTPVLLDSERIGADMVFFSATKYLAGAASVVAGMAVDTGRYPWHDNPRIDLGDLKAQGQGALIAKIRKQMFGSMGPSLSAMNAFMLMAGMESLPLRLERMSENALKIAAFLDGHPKVDSVLFPGLPAHPYHGRCKDLFGGFGTILTFNLKDKATCFRMQNALRIVRRATNLGDTRSLAIHPASTIYGTLFPHQLAEVGVTEQMIRLSVGIEHVDDLIADLDQALEAV